MPKKQNPKSNKEPQNLDKSPESITTNLKDESSWVSLTQPTPTPAPTPTPPPTYKKRPCEDCDGCSDCCPSYGGHAYWDYLTEFGDGDFDFDFD
jgi:hypothetical protein